GEITMYSGNYDFYERERGIREANREAAYARQQAMLAKEQRFIDRFAAHAAKAAQVQSRVKALEKIEKIQLPKRRRVVQFDFRMPPRSGDQVAVLEDVTKAYGRRVVHDGLTLTIRRRERWCAMGKNGAGKSTLLKIVAGQLTPDRGRVRTGASVKMGYFAQQSLDLLDPDLTIDEQLEDFDGTMLFVSHDREFLRGLSNRVLELGGETGTEAEPHIYLGSYVEYVERTGHEAPGVHA